jgi:hypothetical protein
VYLLEVLFAVLGVRAHPLDQDNPFFIFGLDDQSVVVSFDVENDFVVAQKTGTWITVFTSCGPDQ